MPQLIFFALVGVAAYFGYRSFVREAERVTAKVRRAREAGWQPARWARWSRIPRPANTGLAKD